MGDWWAGPLGVEAKRHVTLAKGAGRVEVTAYHRGAAGGIAAWVATHSDASGGQGAEAVRLAVGILQEVPRYRGEALRRFVEGLRHGEELAQYQGRAELGEDEAAAAAWREGEPHGDE